MKAIEYHRYGSADFLELKDIDRPVVNDDGVLVRVRAASVNPLDWHFMRGTPYLVRAFAGLRDKGKIQTGYKVLINGAAGGVGTFAVQIAKSFGADVTGVCSTRNVDMVRSIGADHVIDYSREDFTRSGQRYDLIFDTAGNHSLSACRRALNAEGALVLVGGPDNGRWLGPLTGLLKASVLSRFVSQRILPLLARLKKQDDLTFLRELLEAGTVTPVIDRTYPLSQVFEAIRYLEQGHARGKVVITVQNAS